jgi:hypothetical protein
MNGNPVLFYLPRKYKAAGKKYAEDTNIDDCTTRLFGLLKNMGTTLKISQVRTILNKMYPDALPTWPIDQVELRKIFNYVGGGR